MVLEEATNSSNAPPDSFADNPYPSDSDPYSASNEGAPARHLDLNDFPLPPALLGALVGYSRQRLANNVSDFLRAAQHLLRRPVTEEEARAIAYHTLRANTTTAYGSAIGVALAMARCHQTRHNYRFPFFSPETSLNGFVPEALGPLRGHAARAAWHTLRVSAYGFVGLMTARVVVGSYAAMTATVRFGADERLKDFNATVRQFTKERKRERALPKPPGDGAPHPANAPPADNNGGYDDMSPSTGAYSDSYSDAPVRAEGEVYRQRQQGGQPAVQQQSRWGQEQPAHQQDSMWDDASPTGGLGPMDAASATTAAGGGSAWDRVRQQASGRPPASSSSGGSSSSPSPSPPHTPWGRSTPQQKEQRAGTTLGDSFTFSKSDEERQLAKAEAQREFDERMEQERRGVDFNEGGKKW